MTKPLGTPQNRDTQDNQGTFYGHPIVIRVKDLSWQPPAQPEVEPQQDWVSNLLGEDPQEGDTHESLLVPAAAEAPPEPVATPAAKPAPEVKAPVAPQVQPAPEPATSAKPSYIHNSTESRKQRRASILSSQMKNRLALGGMAVSLLLVSFWALSGSGDSEESPVENVPQDLFVSTGELGDAPAWNAGTNPAASDPSETITVEPLDNEIPQMASLPTRSTPSNPMMSNPSRDTQMTSIATPASMDVDTSADPYSNPAPESIDSGAGSASGEQLWQFGPSNVNPDFEEPAVNPYSGGSIPSGDVPNFDNSQSQPYGQQPAQTRPLPGGSMDLNDPRTSQSPAPTGDDRHWMQKAEGKYTLEDGTLTEKGSSTNNSYSATEMPQISEGYQHQAGMPVVNNQMPANSPAPGTQQDNGQWGFGPYSGSSMPQEAAQPRARLGGIQPLDLESR